MANLLFLLQISIDISFSSILLLIFVILFTEFCVFCYFTPNLIAFFRGDSMEESLTEKEEEEFSSSLVVAEEKQENWLEDDIQIDETVYDPILEFYPQFKIDEFSKQIYELYTCVSESYTNDTIRNVAYLLSKELYQKNVRQLDSFRKKNLQHIVQVESFVNCRVLKAQIVEENLFVKVELVLRCYDYIIHRHNQKLYQGIMDKPLICTYHLILRKKPSVSQESSNLLTSQLLGSSIPKAEENLWILFDNKIVRRRSISNSKL